MLLPEAKNHRSLARRLLDAWRDRRLSRLPDRSFCRRVSLEGWERIARAADARRGLLIAVGESGLPRTAARALALYAAAFPLESLAAPRAAEALAAGAVFYAAAGSPRLRDLGEAAGERLEVSGEKAGGGARVIVRAQA